MLNTQDLFFFLFTFTHHGLTLLGCSDVFSCLVDPIVAILGSPCTLPNISENSDGFQGL